MPSIGSSLATSRLWRSTPIASSIARIGVANDTITTSSLNAANALAIVVLPTVLAPFNAISFPIRSIRLLLRLPINMRLQILLLLLIL